jgi:hypothetical protein
MLTFEGDEGEGVSENKVRDESIFFYPIGYLTSNQLSLLLGFTLFS